MEIRLPETQGWSAAPLLSGEWDNLGVVVKREYTIMGDDIVPMHQPRGICMLDELDSDDSSITKEADTALYKSAVDWHFLGYGTVDATLVETAELAVDGQSRALYERIPGENIADPVNLFGFEPRDNRTGVDSVDVDDLREAVVAQQTENDINGIEMDPVTLARTVLENEFSIAPAATRHSTALFRSSRFTQGYSTPNEAEPVPNNALIVVTADSTGGTDLLLSLNVSLPQPMLIAYLWEGGPDREAYWCQREPVALVIDTVTLSTTSAQVLWRTALPGATHAITDMRLIRIEETV